MWTTSGSEGRAIAGAGGVEGRSPAASSCVTGELSGRLPPACWGEVALSRLSCGGPWTGAGSDEEGERAASLDIERGSVGVVVVSSKRVACRSPPVTEENNSQRTRTCSESLLTSEDELSSSLREGSAGDVAASPGASSSSSLMITVSLHAMGAEILTASTVVSTGGSGVGYATTETRATLSSWVGWGNASPSSGVVSG